MTLSVLRRPSVVVCALLAAFVVAAPMAHAQVLYGSLVGNVTDSTGAALPGATVTIEQTETKLTRELVTDSAGAYHFTAVPPGTYADLGHDDRVPAVEPPQCPGLDELGGARRCEAGRRAAHRNRQRVSRDADPADRPRGGPLRVEGTGC